MIRLSPEGKEYRLITDTGFASRSAHPLSTWLACAQDHICRDEGVDLRFTPSDGEMWRLTRAEAGEFCRVVLSRVVNS